MTDKSRSKSPADGASQSKDVVESSHPGGPQSLTPGETLNQALSTLATEIPVLGGVVRFMEGRALTLQLKRFEQFARRFGARVEQLDQDKIDADYLESDEFFETFDQLSRRAAVERNGEKREQLAALLSTAVSKGADRSWLPTAVQLLERIEPVHVEIIQVLLQEQDATENYQPGRGIDTGSIVTRLWPEDDFLRRTTPEEAERFKSLRVQILEHLWYLGGTGLISQIGKDSAHANELARKLIRWLIADSESD